MTYEYSTEGWVFYAVGSAPHAPGCLKQTAPQHMVRAAKEVLDRGTAVDVADRTMTRKARRS